PDEHLLAVLPDLLEVEPDEFQVVVGNGRPGKDLSVRGVTTGRVEQSPKAIRGARTFQPQGGGMAGWTVFSGRWGSRAALCVALAVAVSLSACGDSPEDEAIPPTRTLVPPSNTPVVSPIPLTPTPTELPGPSSFSLAGTP